MAEIEGDYSGGNRGDLKVIYRSMNVPVEVKRHYNKEVWEAPETQLQEKYAIDPGTGGYGSIWFSGSARTGRTDGCRRLLRGSLGLPRRRKWRPRSGISTRERSGTGSSFSVSIARRGRECTGGVSGRWQLVEKQAGFTEGLGGLL